MNISSHVNLIIYLHKTWFHDNIKWIIYILSLRDNGMAPECNQLWQNVYVDVWPLRLFKQCKKLYILFKQCNVLPVVTLAGNHPRLPLGIMASECNQLWQNVYVGASPLRLFNQCKKLSIFEIYIHTFLFNDYLSLFFFLSPCLYLRSIYIYTHTHLFNQPSISG